MQFNEVMTAGQAKEINEAGNFFRIIASPNEDIDVKFYLAGREVANVDAVGAGYWERVVFDKVTFTSAAGGAVRIVTRHNAEVGYDRAVGAVNIAGTVVVKVETGNFFNSAPAVGTGSGQLLPANSSRRYLLIQNNHASAILYIRVDGGGVTGGNGIRLMPGESLEFQGRVPTGQINALATAAIAAGGGVVVVEG